MIDDADNLEGEETISDLDVRVGGADSVMGGTPEKPKRTLAERGGSSGAHHPAGEDSWGLWRL